MERVEQRRGGGRKVTAAVRKRLRGWVQTQPEATLAELQQKLEKAQHLQVSIARLWQVLRQMGLRLKKKSLHASERDTEENLRRQVFQETVLKLKVLRAEESSLRPNDRLQFLHLESQYQNLSGVPSSDQQSAFS